MFVSSARNVFLNSFFAAASGDRHACLFTLYHVAVVKRWLGNLVANRPAAHALKFRLFPVAECYVYNAYYIRINTNYRRRHFLLIHQNQSTLQCVFLIFVFCFLSFWCACFFIFYFFLFFTVIQYNEHNKRAYRTQKRKKYTKNRVS